MWYKKYLQCIVLSQSTRVTDGQTDRQNYDSQDRPRICSRGLSAIAELLVIVVIQWLIQNFVPGVEDEILRRTSNSSGIYTVSQKTPPTFLAVT